mmetsp:Transcript_86160/g.230021  ORF Transcript_86160/g.230021 Transcript_86160/m.230021 type:complete len:209 (-) Transcript_86160:1630-2256(-)
MPDTVMAGNDGFPFVLTTAVRQHFTLFWAMVLLWKGYIQLSVRGLDLNENGSVSAGEVQIFVLKNLPSAVDWTSAIVLILSFMMRCLSWGQTEANLLAAASVLLFCNLLLVCIPFQSVGGIIITVYRVLFGDFLRFIFVFGAMIFAFACSPNMYLEPSHVVWITPFGSLPACSCCPSASRWTPSRTPSPRSHCRNLLSGSCSSRWVTT